MKLKEIPSYLIRALQLKRIPLTKLRQPAAQSLTDFIVSLTSIEPRLGTLDLVIRSLLSQSVRAEKVILWLHHDLERRLPKRLEELESEAFEIRYSEELGPHRKLVEPLRNMPHTNVITCDDDMLYPADWLERLVAEHYQFPDDIVAHECRKILQTGAGDIRPYAEWVKENPGESHSDTISVGYGGVLYPSGCLPPETIDKEKYLKLAPKADDLWFKAMSLIGNTAIRRTQNCEPMPIPILGSQRVALKRGNIGGDLNRQQWLALKSEFNF